MDCIISTYRCHLFNTDSNRINNFNYSQEYKNIQINPNSREIIYNSNYQFTKLFSQIRVANTSDTVLYLNGNKIHFSASTICTICNTLEEDDLHHFYISCPILSPIRQHYLDNLLNMNIDKDNSFKTLFTGDDDNTIKKIYYYTINALKLRTFALE